MNPAQHSIVRFVDPLEKSYQILNVGSDNMRGLRAAATDTVDLLDITPTILDLMDVAPPADYDGRSILAPLGEPVDEPELAGVA